jgi:hypothetical protein
MSEKKINTPEELKTQSGIYSQVANSNSIRTKFTTNTQSILTPPNSFNKPPATTIYNISTDPEIVYLEPDTLTLDFNELNSAPNSLSDNGNSGSGTSNNNGSNENNNSSIGILGLFGNSTPEESNPLPIFLNQPINTYICIYSIIKSTTPFFKYLFTYNSETGNVEFPKKIINLELSTPPTDNKPTSSIKTQIMNECLEYIIDLFQLDHTKINTAFLERIFKGFILKNTSNSIYLFFDGTEFNYTNISSTTTTNKEQPTAVATPQPLFKMGILDEIINKQSIDKTKILPEIVELFKENPYIGTIYYKNGLNKTSIIYPLCLYLCSKNDEAVAETDQISWKNVHIDDDITHGITVDFPLLGDFYYFSSKPLIDESTEQEPWKRDIYRKYAVFLDTNNGEYSIEESYIVKDLTTINKEQLDNYFQKLNPANISTIWFKYNGIQLWAIKYPTQITYINSI